MTTQTKPEALHGIGERWELLENTFKPYPCGVVAHPAIDAAIELAPQIGYTASISGIVLQCNPLVPELMGTRDPRTGLQARFSAVHGVAAGLVDGRAGLVQFSDERVVAPDVARVRSLVRLDASDGIRRDEARLRVELSDGRALEAYVAHARSSLERPLSEAELFDKVHDLIEPVLPGATKPIETATRELYDAPDIRGLVNAITPRAVAAV